MPSDTEEIQKRLEAEKVYDLTRMISRCNGMTAAWVVSRAYSHVHDHNLLPLLWLSPALDRPRSVTRVLVLDCGNQWRITIILVGFKVATQSEDKFKKMKDVYGKLREEHIQLLRTDSEKKKQLTQLNEKLEQVSLLHYSHTFHSLHVMSSISSSSSSFPPHPFPFLLILFSTTPSMHAFLHTLLYLSPPPSSFPLLHLFASYRSPVHPPILYLSSNPLFILQSSIHPLFFLHRRRKPGTSWRSECCGLKLITWSWRRSCRRQTSVESKLSKRTSRMPSRKEILWKRNWKRFEENSCVGDGDVVWYFDQKYKYQK